MRPNRSYLRGGRITHPLRMIRSNASPTEEWMCPSDIGNAHLGGYGLGVFGDVGSYYPNLWTWAIKLLNIESVIDIGCGQGYSTQFFLESGCDVLGVEGYRQAVETSRVPGRVVLHDYSTGPYVADREFDMAWSCEFVEHVDERYLSNFMDTFASARSVFMTFARFGSGGHHHVNARDEEYWIDRFAERHFEFDEELTECGRRIATADRFLMAPGPDNRSYFVETGIVFVRS